MAGTHEIRGGVYAVGYFDMSGQSNALLPYIDVENSDSQAVQAAMARIVRQLYFFRRDITEYFNGGADEKLIDAAPDGVSSDLLPIVDDYGSPQIGLQGFSDTVVAYVPLGTPKGMLSVYGIGPLLMSVTSTTLMSFARGIAVRGAIDVSWAVEPFANEIYGPALLSVYQLECKAGWPRVVLGNGIQRLWETLRKLKRQTRIDAVNCKLAEVQSDLAFIDNDGKVAVDYLGDAMQKLIIGGVPDFPALIDAAQAGLELLHDSFGSDTVVEPKLRATLDYFESRVGPMTDGRRTTAAEFLSKSRNRH